MEPIDVEDEILLDDSDDDFVDTRRRSKRLKRSDSSSSFLNDSSGTGGKFKGVEDELSKEADVQEKRATKDSVLNESKLKTILNDVAISKKCKVSVVNAHAPSPKTPSQGPGKLSSLWKKAQSQMTPQPQSTSKLLAKTPKSSSRSKMKPITIDDSDPEDDFKKTDSKGRRVTRSKSSLNESILSNKSEGSAIELDDDEELELEIAKIDKLKDDLKKQFHKIEKKPSTPAPLPKPKKSVSTPANLSATKGSGKKKPTQTKIMESLQKIKPKEKTSVKKEVAKPKPLPKIIDTGPWDCFDNLIVQTTAGFPCNFCEDQPMFKKRREMIQHLQSSHDDELSVEQRNRELAGVFVCEQCQSEFHSKHILRTHEKAHRKLERGNCDNYYQYYMNIRVF